MRKDESYILRMSEYVKRNLKKGYKRDAVRFALISQGNSKLEVDKALNFAEKDLAQEELRAMPKKVEPTFIMPIVEPEKEPFWKRLFG
jgi:hypothetical protein